MAKQPQEDPKQEHYNVTSLKEMDRMTGEDRPNYPLQTPPPAPTDDEGNVDEAKAADQQQVSDAAGKQQTEERSALEGATTNKTSEEDEGQKVEVKTPGKDSRNKRR